MVESGHVATVLISDWSPCLRVSGSALPERLPTLVYISTILSTYCPSVPECRASGRAPSREARERGARTRRPVSRGSRGSRGGVITTHISRDTILGSRGGGGFIFSRNMQTTVDNLHTLEDCSTAPPRARPAAQRAINITLPAVSRVRGSCLGLNTGHSAQWPELGGRSGARTPDHACPSAVLYR